MNLAQNKMVDSSFFGVGNLDQETSASFGVVSELVSGNDGPRWYQADAIDVSVDHILNGFTRVLIVSPTGSGKTHIAKYLTQNKKLRKHIGLTEKDKMVVVLLAHQGNLLTQGAKTICVYDNVELHVCTAFSELSPEVIEKGWHICIMDEAHHEPMMSYQKHNKNIINSIVFGLTATEVRGDNYLLKFEKTVVAIEREEAVRKGILAETDLRTVLDFGGVNKIEVLTYLMKHCGEKMTKTIAFLRTQKEADKIAEIARQYGKKAISLSDDCQDIDEILAMFDRGEIDFISNCAKIREGADLKGCEHVIFGMRYDTISQITQGVGRAARPDSACVVWQLVNPLRSSLIVEDVIKSLKSHHIIEVGKDYIHEEVVTMEEEEYAFV